MPDITMCATNDCPRRHECYRYMARPSEFTQSYCAFKSDGCKEFIPMAQPQEAGE